MFFKIIVKLKNNIFYYFNQKKRKNKDETGFKTNVKDLTTYSLSKYPLQLSIRFYLHEIFKLLSVNSIYLQQFPIFLNYDNFSPPFFWHGVTRQSNCLLQLGILRSRYGFSPPLSQHIECFNLNIRHGNYFRVNDTASKNRNSWHD